MRTDHVLSPYCLTKRSLWLTFLSGCDRPFRMSEKVAIVTGTSSGFGLLISVELAKAGFRVVATMRDLSRRGPLDQMAGSAGVFAQIDVRCLDVTNFAVIPRFVEEVLASYGRIDVLVNNAGFASLVLPRIFNWMNCGCNLKRISSALLP